MPRVVRNGVKYANPWEAEEAARLDRWQATGTVRSWWYGLRIPLSVRERCSWTTVPDDLSVVTRTGRQAVYVADFLVWFTDGTVEWREVKNNRRSGPEYEKWWLKRQVLRAMGIHLTIVGRDGQPVWDVAA